MSRRLRARPLLGWNSPCLCFLFCPEFVSSGKEGGPPPLRVRSSPPPAARGAAGVMVTEKGVELLPLADSSLFCKNT